MVGAGALDGGVEEQHADDQKQRHQNARPAQRCAREPYPPSPRGQHRRDHEARAEREPDHAIVGHARRDQEHHESGRHERGRYGPRAVSHRPRSEQKRQDRHEQHEVGRECADAAVRAHEHLRGIGALQDRMDGEHGQKHADPDRRGDDRAKGDTGTCRDIEDRCRRNAPPDLGPDLRPGIRRVERPEPRRRRPARPCGEGRPQVWVRDRNRLAIREQCAEDEPQREQEGEAERDRAEVRVPGHHDQGEIDARPAQAG